MKITKELLRQWSACADGFRWFCTTFAAGEAEYVDVQKALRADGRHNDSQWLMSQLVTASIESPEFATDVTADFDALTGELIAGTNPQNLPVVDAAAGCGEAPAVGAGGGEGLDRHAALVQCDACVEIDQGDAGQLVFEAAIDNFDVAVAGEIARAELERALAIQRALQ